MKIPKNMTEAEVTSVILKVAERLAHKYSFSFYEKEDIIQEAWLIADKAMEDYDESRPLENYLAVCLSNRLKTFVRDNGYIHNEGKQRLLNPVDISSVNSNYEKNMWVQFSPDVEMDIEAILRLIDQHLPVHLRMDYIRMKCGVSVPKFKKKKVQEVILGILEEHGYEAWPL